jgi:OmcA/MtrC family decaheme c-type cytochrome
MGEALTNTGYNYGGILFNEVRYPQDIRNCQTCHTSQPQSAVTDAPPTATVTTQGDNWMSVPSRYACGACHDSIDWVAGTNHLGGAQTSDAACSGCHSASDIAIYHTPVWTPHQAGSDLAVAHGGMQSNSYQATNPANLPKGAHRIEWNIKSVSVSSAGIPSITFQYLKDGIPVAFNTNTSGEMMDGFVNNSFSTTESNGPNLALAVGITQDGIAAPADYNFHTSWPIKNIWNGTAKVLDTDGVTLVPVGTFSGPTNGFYTITLTKFPLLNSQLPAGDTFGAVGMGIGLGLLTQSDLTAAQDAALKSNNVTMDFTFTPGNATTRNIGGLLLPSKMKWASVPVVSGQAVPSVQRRTILKEGSCNSCHSTLGAFTAVTGPANFHSVGIGDANAEQSCVLCHNTTGTDGSAWSYNTKTWVHALHASTNAGATMRNNAYTAHSSSGSDFWNIEYPGLLNNCEACHVAGSYDFSNTASAAQVPKMLWDTVAKGTTSASSPSYPTSGFTIIPTGTTPAVWTSGNKYLAPWVDQTTEYGTNVSITAPANVGANWTVNQPAVNTTSSKGSLVVSPITAACSACHDSASDIAHFKSNGGAFYEDRVTALATKTEQCLICHGSGGVADIKTVHSF